MLQKPGIWIWIKAKDREMNMSIWNNVLLMPVSSYTTKAEVHCTHWISLLLPKQSKKKLKCYAYVMRDEETVKCDPPRKAEAPLKRGRLLIHEKNTSVTGQGSLSLLSPILLKISKGEGCWWMTASRALGLTMMISEASIWLSHRFIFKIAYKWQ